MGRRKPKLGMKEICLLLGVTPSTIRLYEQSLEDRRYEITESGRRVFSGASLTQLFDMRYMSRCGMSLSDAATSCQDVDVKSRIDAYVAGEKAIARQAQYTTASLEQARYVRQLLDSVDGRRSRFHFESVEGFYFLECERNGEIVSDPETREVVAQWTEMVPAVYLLNRDVLEDPAGNEWSFRMGLAISERHASLVPVDHRSVRYVPPRHCVVGIVVDENTESLSDNVSYQYSGKILGFAKRYFNENGLALTGSVYHRMIASMLEIEDPEGGRVVGDLWYGIYPVR